MNKKVIVFGSINLDEVYYLNDFPKIGQTIHCQKREIFLGGKGINQAMAISKMNVETTFVGKVGDDENSLWLVKEIKRIRNKNLKLGHLEQRINTQTGIASIYIDKKGQNNIVLFKGANDSFLNEKAEKYLELIEQHQIVLVQLEINFKFTLEILKLAKSLNKITILNPAPARKLPKEMILMCDYIIPNETELAKISNSEIENEDDLFKILTYYKTRFPNTNLIATFGPRGVFFLNENEMRNYGPKTKINVVDTTAAGDSFIGGFVSMLSMDQSINEAIKFGIKVASVTITRKGAAASIPDYEEVWLKDV